MRAIDQLKRDGFVRASGRQGLFVSETPPHLCQYALVFPNRPEDEVKWSGFLSTWASESTALQQSSNTPIRHYLNVDGHIDNPGYQQLLHEANSDQLAGVVFIDPGELMIESMIWVCLDCKTMRTIYDERFDTGLVEDHPWVIPQL